MKNVLTALLLLIGFSVAAQTGNDSTKYTWYKYSYGNRYQRLWTDSVLEGPRDTTFSKYGFARIGSVAYVGNGIKWTQVATPFDTAANNIHSTGYNNTIYFRLADSVARGLRSTGWNDLRYFRLLDTNYYNFHGENYLNLKYAPIAAGVPVGGATGQVLAKINSTDFNYHWIDPATGTSIHFASPLYLDGDTARIHPDTTKLIPASPGVVMVRAHAKGDSIDAYGLQSSATNSIGVNPDSSRSVNSLLSGVNSVTLSGVNFSLSGDTSATLNNWLYGFSSTGRRQFNNFLTLPLADIHKRGLMDSTDKQNLAFQQVVVNDMTYPSLDSFLYASPGLDSLIAKRIEITGAGVTNNSNGHKLSWAISGGGGLTAIANHSYLGVSNLTGSTATPVAVTQPYYVATDYPGIVNDSSADITAGLQALINFVPAGSVIYFPVGKYRQDGGDTVGNKQIKFLGPMSAMRNDGVSWSGTQNCTIFHGNASDSAFRIEGAGVSFENISISYTGTGTSTGWGIYYHNGYYARMNHTLLYNFGTLLEMKNAAEYVVDDCFFIYAHNASGVIISDSLNPDNGDGVFNNCYFTNYGGTTIQNAFRWNSGGGLRMTNSKFNGGFKNCFYAPFIGSIDGQVVNCAFENYDSSAIKFLLPAAGTINNLIISQNYMNGTGAGGHISLTGIAAGSLIQAVNISGNQFYGHGTDTAIYVNGPKFIYIGANSYAKVGRSIAGTINNVSTNSLWVNFPDGIQALTESSNAVVMDLGFGSTGSFTITGNDTLKLFSAFNSQTKTPTANQGFAQGAPFRVKVVQDATGGHNLITQGYGLNYTGGTTGNAVIGLDTRANAVTIVEGYVNNNGAPTITKTSRYMESKAIPYMAANNALGEDITNFNYDDTKLMLTGARMKLLPLTKLSAADGQFQYDGTHLFFDVGTTHYQIDQQTAGSITLTTTGTSGPATLVGSTLNIPVYSGGGGGTPGGSDTYVQFNDGGAFGGVSNFTFDKSTNILNVNKTIGATATDGFQLFSSGAATLGNQQYSPSLDLKGFGWATTPSTSQPVNFKIYNVPVQGTANPAGTLFFQGQVNGGTNVTLLTLNTAGIITNGGSQINSAVFNVAGVSNFTSDLWVSSTTSTSGMRISNSGGNNYIDAKGSAEGFNFRTNTNGINAMHLDGANGGSATFGVLTNQGRAQVEAVATARAQFSAIYDATHYTNFTTNSAGKLTIAPSGGSMAITGYGSGTNTGTATYGLSVDASGNLIEGITVASADYTPTVTTSTNCAAATATVAFYSRVGNKVHVSIRGSVTATASATDCAFTVTIPTGTNANLASNEGSGTVSSTADIAASVNASSGTVMIIHYLPTSTSATPYGISFDYSL